MARTLIILRHGKAEPVADSGLDVDRALAPIAQQQIPFVADAIAKHLTGRGCDRLRVAASFVLRARQTAALLIDTLSREGVRGVLTREPMLEFGLTDAASSATAADFNDAIAAHFAAYADSAVALVGHNPLLERLANALASPNAAEHRPLQTGMACLFSVADTASPLTSATLLQRVRYSEDD